MRFTRNVLRANYLLIVPIVFSIACSKKADDDQPGVESVPPSENLCLNTHKAECDQLNIELTELRSQREAAIIEQDAAQVNQTTVDINYRLEKIDLLSKSQTVQSDFDKLDSKYVQLRELVLNTQSTNSSVGNQPTVSSASPLNYKPAELAAVKSVLESFGDLYIKASSLNAQNQVIAEEYASPMPWSGYWYPLRDKAMYGPNDAPLRKFDRVANTKSVDWEKSNQMSMTASWEGLCGAWAVASVIEKEPSQPVVFRGETFTVSYQLPLLIIAYYRFDTRNFGNRYDGDSLTDGARADIRPEAFHRIAESFLKENKKPFIIDDTAGIEVWNKPVYRIKWQITKDPVIKDAYLVKAWPWMVRERQEIKDDPTGSLDRYAPAAYEYRLYVDPNQVIGGKQRVIAGEWLNGSRENHPDYVMVPLSEGRPLSANPVLNANMDLIFQIVGKR